MAFLTDKQTLDDLNIFGRRGKGAIFDIFNRTNTRGGARAMEEMFRYPPGDAAKINRRSAVIKHFSREKTPFPFRNELFDMLDQYLENTDARTQLNAEDNTLQRRLKGYVGSDVEFDTIHKGVAAAIEMLRELKAFIDINDERGGYAEELREMAGLIDGPEFAPILALNPKKKLSYDDVSGYDRLLRFRLRDRLLLILSRIYTMDAYISAAHVAADRGFAFAAASDRQENKLAIDGMYHPEVKNAVANSLTVDPASNVIFLTGANMAGKSTFMKTLGVTIYLAHLGFPVPCSRMEFAVLDGMFTTINLPDNIGMGYSHFYAEVLRVKKVAQEAGSDKKLLIIFDELFRGTNVKDAYDATVAVTEAFSQNPHCIFIISTHIIEAGDALKKLCSNVNYIYLPTVMRGSVPEYTYTLRQGITDDRHGMMIINNERIVEMLDQGDAGQCDTPTT